MSYYGEQTYCYNCKIPSSGHSFIVPQTCRKYACNNRGNFEKFVIFKDSEIGPIRENETIIYESEITEKKIKNSFYDAGNDSDSEEYYILKITKSCKDIFFYSCCVYCEDCWDEMHSLEDSTDLYTKNEKEEIIPINKIYKKINGKITEVYFSEDYCIEKKSYCPYCKKKYNQNEYRPDDDIMRLNKKSADNYTEHYYEEYIEDIRAVLNNYLINDISNIIMNYIIIYAN